MNNAIDHPKGTIITGHEAIDYADFTGRPLNKYADPIEGARTWLTPDQAREIAKEDPSLIWIEVD